MSARLDPGARPDDEERVRKGTLIDALYRKYHGMLRRFLARRHVNPDEAADIVQETYCRILNAGDAESIRHPRAFLLKTATNVLLNQLKHRRASADGHAGDLDRIELETDDPSPYRTLKGEQEWAIVRQALEELAPKCREVFVMHRFEQMSYSEISVELNLSVSMIEKYVSQALATLRQRLADARAEAPRSRSARPLKSPSP
jgi:RNA polymerase sigma factor (sigma-70 family)